MFSSFLFLYSSSDQRPTVSSLFALFLLTSLANIITPGLGVTMIVVIAAQFGWRKTIGACFGTAVGRCKLVIEGFLLATESCDSRRIRSAWIGMKNTLKIVKAITTQLTKIEDLLKFYLVL